MNNTNNKVTKESGEENLIPTGTSSEETIKRGKAAIAARLLMDKRPEKIKQQEEKEDAKKWRNEG